MPSVVDKLFWITVRRLWPKWKQAPIVVTPETVARWHRAGFRLYWKLISKISRPMGRRQTTKEVRTLIFRMVAENPTWGASRIHGELLMLGFDRSGRTIPRWMKRAPRDPEPGKRWLAFLCNHREAITAMDFFTVPTVTFSVLYCFSSSPMNGGASCTSTSHRVPPLGGSSSSYGRRFRSSRLRGFSSSTAMRSMGPKFQPRFGR